ncbi:Uma2 family endonuclease [Aetokthonos hydrillicola Thurmond2011]|jgi:Uma2 family endonuclease|uniref:Uma2 family endonuclease n=1 Tax=Aetokthonos hydrillicola Thurmond2011 TaxID=2712845 RepID=A0AAP5I5H3_9CYAN|nr:Uma2 family endonuclease [Aetokthonos hydrillicola]MBO3459805.1 Uma2 family endonuclease [Aetokthonos hydrillicola CCALA 1050]MBW4584550.1 Uma2 family endonuclease [Aetokthonos hydrillicola CCALA 1050]MDR9895094.1 Uma2 family endonuclease [Aetokthonos hydrillicola Thurmond2011]
MVTLQLKQIQVPLGQRVILEEISWKEFEAVLAELGEHRSSRVAYSQGILEIMVPLPEHEKAKVIIGDLVKILLDELDLCWEPLGSTTFKREDMAAGVEPDDCFYIQNYKLMIGKERIDLTVDPPPDLAIEIDVTSKTKVSAYRALKVPEIWRYENRKLEINLLQEDEYVKSETSLIFPGFSVIQEIPRFVEMARTTGTTLALRAFRQSVRTGLKLD